MQIHSLPFQGQTPNATHASSLSFIMRHKGVTSIAIITFVLILLGTWQHKAAMVGSRTNTIPTSSEPSPATPPMTPNLPQVDAPAVSQPSTSTKLNVNNQSIPVPQNGSVHTTVPNVNGNSSVDFSTESHSEGTGNVSSQSSTSIQIHSDGQSEIDVMNSE